MSTKRQFFISLTVLIASTLGCLGIVFLLFAFFTYQGNGMDWIYPAGGLVVIIWMGSAFTTLVSGVRLVSEYRESKRIQN